MCPFILILPYFGFLLPFYFHFFFYFPFLFFDISIPFSIPFFIVFPLNYTGRYFFPLTRGRVFSNI
jgi:hypothetical protein